MTATAQKRQRAHHTPGPWTYRKPSEPVTAVAYWIDHKGGPIADVKVHGNEIEDARLIAAAPEQNSALKMAESALAIATSTKGVYRDGEQRCMLDALNSVRAAIAKAEGR